MKAAMPHALCNQHRGKVRRAGRLAGLRMWSVWVWWGRWAIPAACPHTLDTLPTYSGHPALLQLCLLEACDHRPLLCLIQGAGDVQEVIHLGEGIGGSA